MENTIRDQIKDRFRLETSLLRLERQIRESEEGLRQAKFDSRTAWENLSLYQGSFRSILDRFAGRKEEKEAALSAVHRKAEAVFGAAQREREILDRRLTEIRARLEELPSLDDLREQAAGETLQEFYRLEAQYAAEAVCPLLEKTQEALLELRSLLRGDRVGEFMNRESQYAVWGEPDKWAEASTPLLRRLKAALDGLEIPFEAGTYFDAPAAYIVTAAADHNRRDRVNQALDQVEALRKRIGKLREMLDE